MEPTTTALEHSISKLSSRLSANYQLQADDPIHNVTGMLDRIEQIKDAIPQAVTQSLELATTKLSTQFELVSVPLMTSIQEERGTLSAIHDQMTSLEKRKTLTSLLDSLPQFQAGSDQWKWLYSSNDL
jgi:aspartyl-tRNA synthetase